MNYNPNNPYGQPYNTYVQPPVQPQRSGGTIAPSVLSFVFSLVNIPLFLIGLMWLQAGQETGAYIVAVALFFCGLSALLGIIGLIIGIAKGRAPAIVFAVIGMLIVFFEFIFYSQIFKGIDDILMYVINNI